MRKRNNDVEQDVEVNMTPMLDIVFIMLIFFIVTAVFVKLPGVEVLRPGANTAEEVKRVSTMIGVGEDNKIWINKREVTLEGVPVIVEKLKLENPKGKIVIKADTASNSGLVISIVDQLNQLGVKGVSIATRKGGDI